MSDTARPVGLIGPNAVLQLVATVAEVEGRERAEDLMAAAGIGPLPDGLSMIPEAEAARLHRVLRQTNPSTARDLAVEAGRRTAEYILANRIPGLVRRGLSALPAGLAAQLLARAIARHSWTFAGSGSFRLRGPWSFEIRDNPMIRGEVSAEPICHWHASVFERLFQELVAPDCRCHETECCAQPGHKACRFLLIRGA
ncbi:MAG: bacteriochlorophyll 4-vinyl reductase [Pseudomonadota bacterium]